MGVKIIEIAPKVSVDSNNVILAHSSIQDFKWINEETSDVGISNLPIMFDWVVNKKGYAYVRIGDSTSKIRVFGAMSPTGQKYLRCFNNGDWSDELLELPEIS